MWNTFYQQYPHCNQLPGQFNPYVPQFPMYQMPGFNQQMMMPMQPMAYGFQAPQFMSTASQQYYQQNKGLVTSRFAKRFMLQHLQK